MFSKKDKQISVLRAEVLRLQKELVHEAEDSRDAYAMACKEAHRGKALSEFLHEIHDELNEEQKEHFKVLWKEYIAKCEAYEATHLKAD